MAESGSKAKCVLGGFLKEKPFAICFPVQLFWLAGNGRLGLDAQARRRAAISVAGRLNGPRSETLELLLGLTAILAFGIAIAGNPEVLRCFGCVPQRQER